MLHVRGEYLSIFTVLDVKNFRNVLLIHLSPLHISIFKIFKTIFSKTKENKFGEKGGIFLIFANIFNV